MRIRPVLAFATFSSAVAAVGVIAACSVSASITVPNLNLTAGAACTNTDPDASADAGGCGSGTGLLCVNSYCVGEGVLRFSMLFDVDSDFDIHVKTPEGNEIYYANRMADNGNLDVDQCVSSCGAGQHVENIVFSPTATAGTYTVWAVNYQGRATGMFELDAVADGQTQSFTGTLPAQDMAVSQMFTYVYPPPPIDAGIDAPPATDAQDGATE
jgi:hypothetical protein